MRQERLLLVFGIHPKTSMNHRGYHLARHLAKHFACVDLVCFTKVYDGPSTDPTLKKGIRGLRALLSRRVETIQCGNVVQRIVRLPPLPVILDSLTRDFWTYANVRRRLKEHYDVCIFGHPRNAFVPIQLKKSGRVTLLVYDDWDYFPAARPAVPFWRGIMRYREKMCVRSADGVVSVSRELQQLRQGQGARQTALVPNGVDYGLFSEAQDREPHPPTLLYMGSLASAWGVDLLIRALPLIRRQRPDTCCVLVGTGPEEGKLRAMAAEFGLQECVHFYGKQEYRDLPRFVAKADIGVATSTDCEFRKYACPLKIFEYMAGGLPVIGTRVGETQAIIEESGAGELVEFSPEAFAGAALDLLSNRGKYEQYSANAVAFARKHDWERLVDQAVAFMRQLA